MDENRIQRMFEESEKRVAKQIREKNDIVEVISGYVDLAQRGKEWWGRCPFHEDTDPSLKVSPEKQLFYCFGCGVGGDVIDFVRLKEKIPFKQALARLAARAGMKPPYPESAEEKGKGRGTKACEEAATWMQEILLTSPDGSRAREYLASRGVEEAEIRKWRLGWAPGGRALTEHLLHSGFSEEEIVMAGLARKNAPGRLSDFFFRRIMFPIAGSSSEVCGFAGRTLEDRGPKYLNSPEGSLFRKRELVFGDMNALRGLQDTGTAVVMEGYMDVIAAHKAGITNAVACMGTAFSAEQERLIVKNRRIKRIVCVFDGDKAGQFAAARALRVVGPFAQLGPDRSVEHYAAYLPDGLDPAEFIVKEGGEALKALIAEARPMMEHHLEAIAAGADLSSRGGRADALYAALRPLEQVELPPHGRLADTPLAVIWAAEAAAAVGLSEQAGLSCLRGMDEKTAAKEEVVGKVVRQGKMVEVPVREIKAQRSRE